MYLLSAGFCDFLGEMHGCTIDDRQLLGSWFAYLRASHMLDSYAELGVVGMDDGPFGDCRICSKMPQPPGKD